MYIQCTCIYEYDVPQTIIYSTKFWYFLQIGTFNHCRNNYWLNSFDFFLANLALSSCKLSTFYMCYNTQILLFPGLWPVQISSLSFRCNICPQSLSHRILGGGGGRGIILFLFTSPVSGGFRYLVSLFYCTHCQICPCTSWRNLWPWIWHFHWPPGPQHVDSVSVLWPLHGVLTGTINIYGLKKNIKITLNWIEQKNLPTISHACI